MTRTKNTLSFTALLTELSGRLDENGMIRVIHLTLPNFTTAASVSQIDIYDEDSSLVYTNATGWADNGSHTIGSLAIPIDRNYTIKLTLNAASGGSHDAVVKCYIENYR